MLSKLTPFLTALLAILIAVAIAPATASAQTLARPQAGHDHSCPACGRDQYVQSGQHADGSHTHTCSGCGTSWRHGGTLGYPGTRGGTSPARQPVPATPAAAAKPINDEPHGWGTYQDARAAASAGKTVLVAVGVRDRSAGYWIEELPGWEPGVYKCYKGADGKPKIETVPYTPPAAPVPVRQQPQYQQPQYQPRQSYLPQFQFGLNAPGIQLNGCVGGG